MFNRKIYNDVVADFNLCYLVSLLILSSFAGQITRLIDPNVDLIYLYLVLPLINAVLSVGVITGLYWIIHKRVSQATLHSLRSMQWVAAITGLLSIYAIYTSWVTFGVFLFVIFVTVENVKIFLRKVWGLLDPNATLTGQNIIDLSAFLISMITAFVLLNLTTQALHDIAGEGKAFNFSPGAEGILDSVYFTFTFMTTVGFGDIVPLTPIAKVIVSFECVASYIMMALVIGVVNRGVVKK